MTALELYIIVGLTCAAYSTYENTRAILTGWLDPAWNDKTQAKVREQLTQLQTMGAALPKPLLSALLVLSIVVAFIFNTYVWPYWVLKFFMKRKRKG